MLRWARTEFGWAINLDGSDAAERFSLPRLELRSSRQGWRERFLLADGTAREFAVETAVDSTEAAKVAAVRLARDVAGSEYRPALGELLAACGR
jgi:hypothetical protein